MVLPTMDARDASDPNAAAAAEGGPGPTALDDIGADLVQLGKLTPAGLERALRARVSSGDRLDHILVKLGLAAEADVAAAVARHLRLPLAEPEHYPAVPLLEDRVSTKFLKQARVIPIAEDDERLSLAMADPFDRDAIRAMGLLAGKAIAPYVARPAELEAALERLYGRDPGLSEAPAAQAPAEDEADDDVQRLKDMASEAPVIRMVNHMIAQAVESRASDIHLEPFEGKLRLRYRIDGVLREFEGPTKKLSAAVVSRIKIMAKLNIAERRLPQDGRVKLAVRGKEIDLRVASMPTMHGEHVVMRILDRGTVPLDFAALGFEGAALARYLELLHQPHGILLVTGPTGSGKTTTLYASLLELNTPDVNILTVEDPVEYQLDGVNQVHVKPQIGLTFASALRAFLRQDPDIIMVGEIRDVETAQIAVQASLTGHLVLSTLHTNNAASSISRLLDMGVEDYLLNSTLIGIVAQRLVRTLCLTCREPYRAPPELLAQLRPGAVGEATFYRARGCPKCNNTGYAGRTGILELLPMSEGIGRLVLKRAEAREIQRLAQQEGMRTMYEDGIAKALAGLTTPEEVMRVIRGE